MKPDKNKQIFTCYIKTLSPVHIGCDEVYEPTGFVMDEQAGQMVVFHPVDFISGLSKEDRRKFNDICSKGTVSSILEIYKFLRNRPASGRKVDVCKGFVEHYKTTLSMNTNNEKKIQQELNRFLIPRTSFSPLDQRPYFPGSSVKGSLRTAYLNLMGKKKHLSGTKRFNKGQELEKKLMDYKSIDDDPFRLVKVSDFMPVGDVKTKIVYGVNVKKKKSDKEAQGGAFFFEIIEPGAIFEGKIIVETPEKGAGIKDPVELETLLKGADVFYLSEKKREDGELNVVDIANSVLCDENAVLLRCGRHSGAESVTIDGYRSIKIMGKRGDRPRYLPHATTFWLTSDVKKPDERSKLRPFGWAGLYKTNDESRKNFSVRERKYQEELAHEKQKKIQAAKERQKLRRERAEAEEKKEREAEAKRLAEKQRQDKIKLMSPEELEIEALKSPAARDEKFNIVSKKLDSYQGNLQIEAARLLKAHLQSQNKWTKKDLKKQWPKQRDKINRIKEILGIS